MPFKYKRICPVCGKESLGNISSHLQQVHKLSSVERKPYLKKAKYQGITVYSKDEIQSLPVVHISGTPKCSKQIKNTPSLNEDKDEIQSLPTVHISETRKCSKQIKKIPSLNKEKQVVDLAPVNSLRKRKQKRKTWLITL